MAEQTPLERDIEAVAQMNDKQITEVRRLLSTSTVNFIECRKTAEKLNELGSDENFDAKRITELASSLAYIKGNLGSAIYEGSIGEYLPDLLRFNDIDPDGAALTEQLYKNLERLFSGDEDEADTDWHRTGIVDVVLDFDSFLDIRPVFIEKNGRVDSGQENPKKEFKYNEVLPLIIFRIAVQKDFAGTKSYVFQMTEKDFSMLEEEVERIKSRLALTKNIIEEKFSSS